MKLLVGIDVSSETLDVCYLQSDQKILNQMTVDNSLVGASLIQSNILTYTAHQKYEQIIIGLESTSVYSFHPATFLHQDEALQALNVTVSVINPTKIHRFKKMFDEDKTDRVDAYRIADFLRLDIHQNSLIKEEQYLALQRLTRSRYQLVTQLTECKQHFIENLYYKCNTFKQTVDTPIFGIGFVPAPAHELLLEVLARRANFLISGGTGSGKTVLLGALLSEVAADQRLLVVEDSRELLISHPHVVQLAARQSNVEGVGEVAMTDLVRNALRMRPDRLVVGECRGAEVRDMLTALNTGHEGGCATIHANTAQAVTARLEALGALAGMSPAAVRSQMATAIDLVIHVRREGNTRGIAQIAVPAADRDTRIEMLPVWDAGDGFSEAGVTAVRRLLEQRAAT